MTTDIADLPAWITEALSQQATAPRVAAQGIELDTPFAVEEAQREIARQLGQGQPEIGDSSDDRTYRLACRLKDYGLSYDKIIEILSDQWAPHFDPDWLAEKVSSAFRNGQNAPGSDRPQTDEEVFAGVDTTPPDPTSGLSIQWACHTRPKRVDWLWPGFIALGKYTALAGVPGTGKSTMAFDFAATITAGGKWPDGRSAPQGKALIWSGEDDFDDTILPRFLVAGGDGRHFGKLKSVTDLGQKRAFDPARDASALMAAVADMPDLALLIIDPIVSAVAGDDHKNGQVRRGLAPLIQLAEDRHFALLGITHFTKNTQGNNVLDRVTGSLAYGAAARVVLCAGKDENDEAAPRRLVRAKSNLQISTGGFDYLLRQDRVPGEPADFTAQRIVWGKVLHGSAFELLGGDGKERDALLAAVAWLDATLRGRSMTSRNIRAEANEAGHAWRTLLRAKDKLGVSVSKNVGAEHGGWCWRLEEAEPASPL